MRSDKNIDQIIMEVKNKKMETNNKENRLLDGLIIALFNLEDSIEKDEEEIESGLEKLENLGLPINTSLFHETDNEKRAKEQSQI